MAIANGALELLVRRLELHMPLSVDDRAALLALPFSLRTLEASSYMVREGDPPKTCAVLLSGFAFRQKLTRDGARQIMSLHVPGEALDFQNLFLEVADHNVQTLTRADIAIIPRDAVRRIALERPDVGRAILIYTLVEASIFREWLLNIGRRDARTRLAHLLCEFAVRIDALQLGGGQPYELPMSQDQLADTLGLTPIHVNRMLKSLEADGLISRDKRHISFPQWQALKNMADFSERYLHFDPPGARPGTTG